MIAFVTGGTGFIGSHLVDALHAGGATGVRCLVRGKERWLTGKSYERVSGDLHDLEALRTGCKGADVVYHLAGAVKAPNLKAFVRENVEGTENVVRIAMKSGVKRIVVLSSLAAAGPSRGEPLIETDPRNPVSSYGRSKQLMEEALEALPTGDAHIAVIRPPAVYGPREENILPLFKMMNRGLCPVTGGNGTNRVSMVYVKDLVAGILTAAENAPQGVRTFFISGEQPYSWTEIAGAASTVLGRRVQTIIVPPGLVTGAGKVLERLGRITGRGAFFDREKAVEVTSEWMCSIDRARTELGYKPTHPLVQGLAETFRWYQTHHWL